MEVGSSSLHETTSGIIVNYQFSIINSPFGGLAQLARAPALQAGGQRFESVILHYAARMLIDEAQAKSISDNSRRREIFDILTQDKTVESKNN